MRSKAASPLTTPPSDHRTPPHTDQLHKDADAGKELFYEDIEGNTDGITITLSESGYNEEFRKFGPEHEDAESWSHDITLFGLPGGARDFPAPARLDEILSGNESRDFQKKQYDLAWMIAHQMGYNLGEYHNDGWGTIGWRFIRGDYTGD